MSLGTEQRKFTLMVADLVHYAYTLGWELSFGDAYRDPRCDYGHIESLHRKRLAVDFNIFKDGVWLTDGTGHDVLHDYWDLIGGATRIDADLNHYSKAYGNMR